MFLFSSNNASLRRIMHGAPLGTGPSNVKGNVWVLATTDAATAVEAASYFNSAAGILTVGDIILAAVGIGGTMKLKAYQVLTNNGTAVTVQLATLVAG